MMVNQIFCLVFIPQPTPSPSCHNPWIVGAATWDIETTESVPPCVHPDSGKGPPNCLFVPEEVRSQVLQRGTSSKLTGHPGVQWTLRFLCQHFWWPSFSKDVSGFVVACSVCSWGKASHCPPAGPYQPLSVASCPWSHIAVDFVTVLPPSDRNTPERAYRKSLPGPGACPLLHHGRLTNPWLYFLPWVEYSYNSPTSSATGMTSITAAYKKVVGNRGRP